MAAPLFVHCGLPLAIIHTLFECPDYEEDRREFNLQCTMGDNLGDNGGDLSVIMTFLRAIRLDKFIFV